MHNVSFFPDLVVVINKETSISQKTVFNRNGGRHQTRSSLTPALHFAATCGLFTFAFHAGLFEVFPSACFRKDAVLLNFAVKAFQSGLKRLILADSNFRHQESPLSWPVCKGKTVAYMSICSRSLSSPTCAENYSQALSMLSRYIFFGFVVVWRPKAMRKTIPPKTRTLKRLMVRSSRIAAVERLTALGPV